jgi:hypothetical protein
MLRGRAVNPGVHCVVAGTARGSVHAWMHSEAQWYTRADQAYTQSALRHSHASQTRCVPHVACCMFLVIACCMLHVVACCMSHVVACCMMHVVACCTLHVVACCMFHARRCMLHVARRCMLHDARRCMLHDARCCMLQVARRCMLHVARRCMLYAVCCMDPFSRCASLEHCRFGACN